MAKTQIIVLLAFVGVAAVAAWKHVTVNDCLCTEKGNSYSPISSDDCRSFTQSTATLPAQVLKCPYGLQFDVQKCVCNWRKNTKCASNCAALRTYYGNGAVSKRVVKGYQQPSYPKQKYEQPRGY